MSNEVDKLKILLEDCYDFIKDHNFKSKRELCAWKDTIYRLKRKLDIAFFVANTEEKKRKLIYKIVDNINDTIKWKTIKSN